MKEKIYNLIWELILTFSNKKSLFASKRIERFIVFSTMLWATVIYLHYHIKTLTSTEFMAIVIGWLGYGGFTMVQNSKDRKENFKEEQQQNNNNNEPPQNPPQ